METFYLAGLGWQRGLSFNFLASLINGNSILDSSAASAGSAFNFLASLINGNCSEGPQGTEPQVTFNFLASLINGNPSYLGPHIVLYFYLLTS